MQRRVAVLVGQVHVRLRTQQLMVETVRAGQVKSGQYAIFAPYQLHGRHEVHKTRQV